MIHTSLFSLCLTILIWAGLSAGVVRAKPEARELYRPNWDSLKKHNAVPNWFKDGKFGIYFHWGPYSVPAFGNEWYPRWMYGEESAKGIKHRRYYDYHCKTYGKPSEFGYKEFIPMFKAEKFDAEKWADLFEKSGAQWAGPVAEHHDGFAMWDSEITPWNATDMGPRQDLVGKLEKAIKKRGMKFVTTFHHAHNPKHYPRIEGCDTSDPRFAKLYGNLPRDEFENMWKDKLVEVIDQYEPDLIWFDFGLGSISAQKREEFLAYYFNKACQWGREVGVTYKGKDLPSGVGIVDYERGRADKLTDFKWLTDTSIDLRSWSYIKNPKYKSTARLVSELVDIVSKNGQLLLNFGPRADGTIPAEVEERLLGLGEWLSVNGEAIYGTHPWEIFGEGETQGGGGKFSERHHKSYNSKDIRFTVKEGNLYAICLGLPEDEVLIKSLADRKVEDVSLLGSDAELEWSCSPEGLRIDVPPEMPSKYACSFRIEL